MKKEAFNRNWTLTALHSPSSEPKTVTLPHDAMISQARVKSPPDGTNTGSKKGYYPGGVWQYAKTFSVPAEATEQHVAFLFEGAYMQARVFINGDLAGQRPYGYSEFIVEADGFLKYGEDNEIKVITQTGNDSRWYSGAGLYRGVSMMTSERVFIPAYGVKITTPDITAQRAAVCVDVTIANESAEGCTSVKLLTSLYDGQGQSVAEDTAPVTVYRGDTAQVRRRLFIKNPELWDVDTPRLYTCVSKLMAGDIVLDEVTETFGVRSLTLDTERGLILNGKSVKLRGACIHHDNGPIGAAAIARAELRRVEKLKAAGFNALRMSHHPAGRALLEACDRVGMLVMDEAFDMWTESKSPEDYSLYFAQWWEKDIESLVNKDYNHPCVIMYSIGNEIVETGKPSGGAWSRRLAGKIRELDSTRFTINSINGLLAVMEQLHKAMRAAAEAAGQSESEASQAAPQGGDINETMANAGEKMKSFMTHPLVTECTAEAYAAVDIAGYNYMNTRYEMDRELFPNRIICGSETYIRDIDVTWHDVMKYPYVIGDFTWTGWDYLGEAGVGKVNYTWATEPKFGFYGEYPWLAAWCGDIDITGYRRPSSYYREIVYGLRKQPYITVLRPEYYGVKPLHSPWSWNDAVSGWSWNGFEGKPVQIEVYSEAEEVALYINGELAGK